MKICMKKNKHIREVGLYVSVVCVFLFLSLIVSTLHLAPHKESISEKIQFYGYGRFLDDGEEMVRDDYSLNYKFWGVPEAK